MRKLLIANRGEIAVRIARTSAELGIATVAVHAEDEVDAPHGAAADEVVGLRGSGPAAHLDVAQVVAVAVSAGCDAVHPGYGFLSEHAGFARACAGVGVTFVGPSPETLELFGDKVAARALAAAAGVPVLAGSDGPTTLEEAQAFLADLGPGGAVMLKAVAGGGGRGMRPVTSAGALGAAYERCASEATAAFGDPSLYVEQLLVRARHVEVQLVGDGTAVSHLWDRECSLQRQRQKLVEAAPAPGVDPDVRKRILAAAVAIGRAASLRNLATVELLVPVGPAVGPPFVFIEANPRLQVEHTVTEAVTGLDLVRLQLELADGASLGDLGLGQGDVPAPRGAAVQVRVNLETMGEDGSARPTAGVLDRYEMPSGPGVRVDGFASVGYRTSVRYDSLLAKVVVHATSGGHAVAVAKARRVLGELRIGGPSTNASFLGALLAHPSVAAGEVHTTFVDDHLAELLAATQAEAEAIGPATDPVGAPDGGGRAGAVVDAVDPLAVLHHGLAGQGSDGGAPTASVPTEGVTALRAPIQGTVIHIAVAVDEVVAAGQAVLVLEAMKMEHVLAAPSTGIVRALLVATGDAVVEGHPLVRFEGVGVADATGVDETVVDLDEIRPDLAEVLDRQARTSDGARPDAVARRRRRGHRTVRENIDDLVDDGTFTEYGSLTVAARRRRHSLDELIDQTPADGLVMGLAQVNGDLVGPERSRVAVLAYDDTVLAGTQGAHNHNKLDRMAELALRWRLPTVFFTEGGGGRPGDTEGGGFVRGFELWGKLSGAVPLVGIVAGRCFAGNAAILGCCDVIIATRDTALGMGGPAMVEGGGLGVFRPEEIGPIDVMQANGVIDVLVEDEDEAVAAAKRYLSYFQGDVEAWDCGDQRLLRSAIPENRLRVYDIRRVIEVLADTGSVLELRPRFGRAMVTAFARIEGRPVGVFANDPAHLGGAIDADASDKAARFLQVCEAFDIPVVSLQDTPGNMVGPEAEKTGLIRHCSRLFVIGANLTVPILSVVLRKSYGLGAIAMTGGSYQAAMFAVAWPTGEFGGMGLEGSVKLGYRNELAAIEDPVERRARFDEMVARAYAAGKALAVATGPALDDVIDPADTRRWILAGLRSLPPVPSRTTKKVPWIDAW